MSAAIAASGIPREEIFVTTKLRNGEQGLAYEAFQNSRNALGLDYVDLYLAWPHQVWALCRTRPGCPGTGAPGHPVLLQPTKELTTSQTQETTIPTLTLNNGAKVPQLGFGVFQVPEEDTQRVVDDALETGRRPEVFAHAVRRGGFGDGDVAGVKVPREHNLTYAQL